TTAPDHPNPATREGARAPPRPRANPTTRPRGHARRRPRAVEHPRVASVKRSHPPLLDVRRGERGGQGAGTRAEEPVSPRRAGSRCGRSWPPWDNGRMPDGPLIVQSDKSLLLEVDHDQAAECRRAIAPFAELERAPEHIHTYRLTPLGLWNARAAGHDAEQVIDALMAYSRYPVPHAL